jgi:type VI secretion system protein ImpJ
MKNLPVHWAEGTFLRPQHFQAAARHQWERSHISDSWDHPYNYGLAKIEIDERALSNQRFEVAACHARMRDGTVVELDWGRAPDPVPLPPTSAQPSGMQPSGRGGVSGVELSSGLAQSMTTQVYLAVPRVSLGAVANVGKDAAGGVPTRYRPVKDSIADESKGGQEKEVEFLQLNTKLLLDRDNHTGFDVLPIAQIQRASDERATPSIDTSYIPPVLSVDVWQPLATGIIRAIYDYIGKNIEVIASQVRNRGITFSSQMTGDLDRMHLLNVLNEAFCRLGCLTKARGVHPFTAYLELCSLVGRLAIFAPERRASPLPDYDHDNLGYIFREVKGRIEALIQVLRPYEFDKRYFVGNGQRMEVTIEQRWLIEKWLWYIGVHYDQLTESERQQIFQTRELDMVVGTTESVGTLFNKQLPGLQLRLVQQPQRALQTEANWLFYQIDQGDRQWQEMMNSGTLAIMFRSSLIRNSDILTGKQQLVLQWRGRPIVLELALWAVAPHAA